MPKVRDIPALKTAFLRLYDSKLIDPSVFLANINKLEAIEQREQKRLLSMAKRVNDRRLAGNEISAAQWHMNWHAICVAREALN